MIWITIYAISAFIFFSLLFGFRKGNKEISNVNIFSTVLQSLIFPLYILFGICVVLGNDLREKHDSY